RRRSANTSTADPLTKAVRSLTLSAHRMAGSISRNLAASQKKIFAGGNHGSRAQYPHSGGDWQIPAADPAGLARPAARRKRRQQARSRHHYRAIAAFPRRAARRLPERALRRYQGAVMGRDTR